MRRKNKRRSANVVASVFAIFALAVLLGVPVASACPYQDILGDTGKIRLYYTSAVYGTSRSSYFGGYTDYRYSREWGWDYSNYVRDWYSIQNLKNLEAIMDKVQYLNALRNLNSDLSLCTVLSYVIDAKSSSTPIPVNYIIVPCQLLKIYGDWIAAGDTSRAGRVGEIIALADFIAIHEYLVKLPTTVGYWYWDARHMFSGVGLKYQMINPDIEIHWANTMTEAWAYSCFIVCWQTSYSAYGGENGPIDGMEVKSTQVSSYATVLHDAEAQVRLSTKSYSGFVNTAVLFNKGQTQFQVYFELAQYKSEFRFGG